MTRPRLLTVLCGPVTAVVLLASGCGGPLDEAADAGAVAQPADEGVAPDTGEDEGGQDEGGQDDAGQDDAGSAEDGASGNGGSDGSGEGSSGGPDVDSGGGGARPAGVGDVEAFENIGASYAEFLAYSADDCDGGRCSLAYDFFDNPQRTEGCAVADFRYDPPKRPNPEDPEKFVFDHGAAVTVVIGCAPGVDPEDETTLEGTGTSEEGPSEETASEETETSEESPSEETTSEETETSEETTEEGTTEEGTGDTTGTGATGTATEGAGEGTG